ncbi:MAG TPA: hypothetical protein VFP61_11515, partial [Acidimicrobiales bacterium]|nr:hypothetical protein [Acidimicrobiales bacterium]
PGAGGGARDPAGAFGRPARGHSGDGVARSGGGARSGGADRRRGWPDDLPERLPPPVRALAGADGGCWVGVVTPAGVVAVPGRWCAGQRIAEVAAGVLDAVGADLGAGVCVTLDDSGERRPDRKVGCMLRATVLGRPLATAAGAVVRLEVACERVTWWQGFRSGTEHTFDRLH